MRPSLATALALSIALALGGCDSSQTHTSAEYLTRAQTHIERGDLAAGAIELKNALRQDPEHAQARWLLGKLHLQTGNGPAAEKELGKARELGVVNDSVLPPLAHALLLQQKYDQVLALQPDTVADAAARAELLAHRGQALLEQRQAEPATAEFDAALQQDAKSSYALLGKARLSAARGELAAARDWIKTLLDNDAGFAPAWDLSGDIDRAENNMEQAVRSYTKAIELQPHNNTPYLLKRALLRAQMKQFAAAQEDVKLLRQHAPKHPSVHYVQGLLDFHQERYPKAQESFELALKENPGYLMATLYLGFTHFQLNNPARAEQLLSDYLARDPYFIPAVRLLTQLKLRKGDYRAAEQLIRPIAKANANDAVALNLLANAVLAQGKSQEAIGLLTQAAALEPDSADAQMRLSLGLLASGNKASGVEQLEAAAILDPDQERADYLLVLTHLRTKAHDQALQAAKRARDKHPDSALPHNLVGLSYMALQQEAEAKQAFEQAAKLAPGDPAANQNLASLALKEGHPDVARGHYQDILAHHADDLDTLLKLAAFEGSQNRRDHMRQRLEQAMSAHPSALEPRLLLARLHLDEDRPTEVFTLLRDAAEKNPDHPAVLATLGEAQLAANEPINAKASLTRALKQMPNSAQLHFLLSQAHIALNDRPAATASLEQALALAPDHFPARVAKGRWLVLDGKTDEAEQHLAVLRKNDPEHPEVLLLEGEIAAARGQAEQASAALARALEKGQQSKYLLALFEHQWRINARDQAVAQLEAWRQSHPEDLVVLLRLAIAKTALQRTQEAIGHYVEILKISDRNVAALNDLAWLLRDSDPARALEYGERAYRLAPESPSVLDTLAVVLLNNGQAERAQRLIERALAKNEKDPAMRYHQAMILERLDRKDDARSLLQKLLAEDIAFGEKEQAQALLARL